eukprot:NODE_2462_length_691_cov_1243.006231_g2011_i0.p2 GENE.NODE_2462_length_691_cov_1243.006231_g2011_i0~~NODE_2462_length_691_cov_1243.006231_g2011_i0.p2  ORF type:complete len:116 (+),score=20.88 NODE_2462_length_691_cov_1243.006231_g2011_i0:112-459(+)
MTAGGFFLTKKVGTWHQVQRECAKRGGYLAVPYNQFENREARKLGGGHLWLGFTDGGAEGKWRFANGKKPCYTNWAPGEPNNYKNEDCAEMYNNGLWNDLKCNQRRRGLCRLKSC